MKILLMLKTLLLAPGRNAVGCRLPVPHRLFRPCWISDALFWTHLHCTDRHLDRVKCFTKNDRVSDACNWFVSLMLFGYSGY